MRNHVIYIPGLGDKKAYGQKIIIQLWRFYGLTPHYLPLGWTKKETFNRKLEKILTKIEALQNNNVAISLVGVSAGASAAINAYAKNNTIHKVVCISGKINNPSSIGEKTFEKNPDFKESVTRVGQSLIVLRNKGLIKNIMSTHPIKDSTVPVADTIISGALEKIFPGRSHLSGIFYAITIGGPIISNFIKG